jgi:hypothetical protein
MILPEDPEKEALQRELDARDLAVSTAPRTVSENNRDEHEHLHRTSYHNQSDLALPPPPYNPDLVQRALPRSSGIQRADDGLAHNNNELNGLSSTAAPDGIPYGANTLSYGTDTTFNPYYQTQAEASTSQITLPSSRFQIDDSAQTIDSDTRNGRRSGTQSLLHLPWISQDGTNHRQSLGERSLIGRSNDGRRRDKGKRYASGQPRGRIYQGLLVKRGWGWKRWGWKRWLLLLGFTIVSIYPADRMFYYLEGQLIIMLCLRC